MTDPAGRGAQPGDDSIVGSIESTGDGPPDRDVDDAPPDHGSPDAPPDRWAADANLTFTALNDEPTPILVLGIGNLLGGDDGVGVRVAEHLASGAAGELPPTARVLDGGTYGVMLLPLLDGVRALVAIDAAELHAEPGTVQLLDGDALRGNLGAPTLTVHLAGFADLLGVATVAGRLPERVALVGVQPVRIEGMSIDLSDEVAAAVPRAARCALDAAWAAHRALGL